MPRFRNRATGVLISVGEDYAARLPAREWEPLDKPADGSAGGRAARKPPMAQAPAEETPAKKAPAKKSPAKKTATKKTARRRRKGGNGG